MQAYSKFCQELKDKQKFRQLNISQNINRTGDFTHNDYLGLSTHPHVIEAAQNALHTYGVGATGSRLLSGNKSIHQQLEQQLATQLGYERVLLFSSGFVANASVIPALLNPKVVKKKLYVFSDKHIHASLHAGCAMAQVRQHRFRHNDLNHLEYLLNKHADENTFNVIFVESVYSMDGDQVHLRQIMALSKQYQALVYLDDSHALGVFGKKGYGLSEEESDKPPILMGTLSKALGAQGGFIATSNILADYFINTAHGFMFSTGLSPVTCAAASAALALLPSLSVDREHIHQRSAQLRSGLTALGYEVPTPGSHIVPLVLGHEQACFEASQRLSECNVHTSVIRHPTVPMNTARLRFAINKDISSNIIDSVLDVIRGL